MYKGTLRPLLFRLDPERAHHAALGAASLLGRMSFFRLAARVVYHCEDPALEMCCFGMKFRNPIGLAAGFDKDARAVPFLASLGFGSLEVGSVTGKPQPGNPRPRIFRFSRDLALINRMGFPSMGADAVSEKLSTLRARYRDLPALGINLGKTKAVPIDDALSDYIYSFERLQQYVDYVALNVSSPNTPELRKLQERQRLLALFRGIQECNKRNIPILVKIAPDLEPAELDDVLACCEEARISGIIATNTTFSRDGLSLPTEEAGGLSGRPLHRKSLDMVSYLFRATRGRIPIVGVGGIFTAQDAWDFFCAGASLVQIYTGLVYEGPSVVRNIKSGLLSLLKHNGVTRLSEVVGSTSK